MRLPLYFERSEPQAYRRDWRRMLQALKERQRTQ